MAISRMPLRMPISRILSRMSPLRMWLNSCAMTPCSSSRLSVSIVPRVTPITAFCGVAPAAKALMAGSHPTDEHGRHGRARGKGHFFDDVQQNALCVDLWCWTRLAGRRELDATTSPPPESSAISCTSCRRTIRIKVPKRDGGEYVGKPERVRLLKRWPCPLAVEQNAGNCQVDRQNDQHHRHDKIDDQAGRSCAALVLMFEEVHHQALRSRIAP